MPRRLCFSEDVREEATDVAGVIDAPVVSAEKIQPDNLDGLMQPRLGAEPQRLFAGFFEVHVPARKVD
jgi:hypothetical protein